MSASVGATKNRARRLRSLSSEGKICLYPQSDIRVLEEPFSTFGVGCYFVNGGYEFLAITVGVGFNLGGYSFASVVRCKILECCPAVKIGFFSSYPVQRNSVVSPSLVLSLTFENKIMVFPLSFWCLYITVIREK